MIQTIIGAILLLLPLGLAVFRRDKKKEIIFLLLVCFLFQTGLSLAVQSVKIFYYPVVLVANILFILVLFSIYFFKDKKIYFGIRNIDLALIFVILVSFACLYQVHFRYSGEITLATDQIPAQYHKVSSMVYPYPYYSDEWYSVSFIKNAINTHSLPLGPSILRVRPFINLEVFFHSFLSGIFLLLKTDPLTSYQIVSIFFNILLICLSYLFLRLNGIKKSISAISSLFILYIACGASLPGIWHLLPVSFGVIFLLLALCFFSQKEAIFALSALILACFCYPPFIFIYAILFVLFLCFEVYHDYIRKRAKEIISIMFGLIPLLVFLVICFFIFAPAFLTSRIFFVAFSGFNQTNFYFQYMIPFPAIVLALAGLPHIYRKTKWLFWLFMFCLSLWTAYLFTFLRFFSEFERLIYLTSVLICMISGLFGFAVFFNRRIIFIYYFNPFLYLPE
ncbi:MAG: hypothetical protein NTW46_03075 [Candidatus Nealsonbacteria bacterium]|nr:hypothetical protein [Candidatus Nealsonbacteria bacterium]